MFYIFHYKSIWLVMGVLALCTVIVNGQTNIDTAHIEIAYNKTSSLIFSSVIKSVDRGSRDILAQKAKGVGNVLQLKAGKERFRETNLTVITADGTLHQFTVNYSEQPSSLTIDLSKGDGNSNEVIFHTDLTEAGFENYASTIAQSKRMIRFANERNNKIGLSLLGIFIKEDVMFFSFQVRNNSNISYDIEFLKFYIRNKAQIKRTASQEIELKPLFVSGNDRQVKGKSQTDLVYALEKFTIPDAKHLDVEMFERNGGRDFNLTIKNRLLVNASPLR